MTELDTSIFDAALWENDAARFIRAEFAPGSYRPLRNLESGGTRIMNATASPQQRTREVVCSNCGDGLGEFVNTSPFCRLGPCCEGLPEPWDFDEDNSTYTAVAGTTPDDPPDDDEPCVCFDCRLDRGELDQDEIDDLEEADRDEYRRTWG